MDYYFFIKLRRKVPTRKHKLGMDTAVSQRWAMRDCYPNPKGILRDEVI